MLIRSPGRASDCELLPRSHARAKTIVAEITQAGGDATALQADASRVEEVNCFVDISLHRLGRIDIWVNNAGADILTGLSSQLSNQKKSDKLIAVDLRGTIFCCWKIAPLMKAAGGGVILNISWDHALHGMPDPNPEMFAAVKGGVLSFSKSLARSYAPEVRVNELAPGWIETSFAEEEMQPEAYQALSGRACSHPLAALWHPRRCGLCRFVSRIR